MSHSKKDGGIYATDSNHRNYETCIAILAMTSKRTKTSGTTNASRKQSTS